jgi:hypothetical protein
MSESVQIVGFGLASSTQDIFGLAKSTQLDGIFRLGWRSETGGRAMDSIAYGC